MEVLFHFQKCTNYLPQFMTFRKMPELKRLVTQLIFSISFDFASRQYHEVWASQLPFHHNFKDSVPPSEASLYGHVNWSLAKTHQQSSLGLSQDRQLQGWWNHWVMHLPVPLTLGRRGVMADSISDGIKSKLHQHYFHVLCVLEHFLIF